MKRRAGERWTCDCGEALIGALSVNMKVSPITVETKDNGNVWLGRSKTHYAEMVDGSYVAVRDASPYQRPDRSFVQPQLLTVCAVLGGPLLEMMRAKNVGLHLNHFADCPMRERFG